MRTVTAAELLKAMTGRTAAMLVTLGILLGAITCLGYASLGATLIVAGGADNASVTNDVVRAWTTMYLLAAVFGAIVVTRDYTTGSIARSVLLSNGRGQLFAAKAVVGLMVGAAFGTLAIVLASVCSLAMPAAFGFQAQWTQETSLILIGMFAVNVMCGLWGVLLGWLIRNQVGAVVTVLLTILLIEPALQNVLPGASKYLITIAMSSVYRDVGHDLLPVPSALLVICGWLGIIAIVGRRLFDHRDVT